jgi:membrane protease YdiL (CAAX protease family)
MDPWWAGVFAFVLTILAGGVWSALLMANLATAPPLPWAPLVMAVVLWLGWWAAARRLPIRANRVPAQQLTWALIAGACSLVSLSGLWIVLFRAVRIAGNPVPDFSKYPLVSVILILTMASLVSSVAEETGFRGYFQSILESRVSPAAAISIQALVLAPGHGSTQGFAWPTLLFYFLVDTMLGTTAYLTNSILPGIAIHAVGIAAFFTLIWPYDHERIPLAQSGLDRWFWIHAVQVVVFGALAIVAYARLAKLTRARKI